MFAGLRETSIRDIILWFVVSRPTIQLEFNKHLKQHSFGRAYCAMEDSDDELIELLSCHRPVSCPIKFACLSGSNGQSVASTCGLILLCAWSN